MKKSILILILATLLTACASVTLDPCRGEENCESSLNSAPFSENYTESTTQNSPVEVTRPTAEIQSETVCTTTAVTDLQKEKSQYDPTESQQDKADENPTEYSESSTENADEKSDIPIQTESPQTETTAVTVTEPEEYEEETEPPVCRLSDYEKALEVYNFMTANGGGTCVQYAYQTYEMCWGYGLECYFAWTESR